jgi:hypothetical protein
MVSMLAAIAATAAPVACRLGGAAAAVCGPQQIGSAYLPSRNRRGRRSLRCLAAGGASQQWRFDDLASSPSSLTSFDDLWSEQLRAMQRAQDRMELQQREMEQRFEAVQREAQPAGGSGRQAVQEHSGPCGYHWQRTYSRNGPGYQEYRSESFAVVGAPPAHCGMMHAPPSSALHMDPLSSLSLLLAAALAGFWAAMTTAFNRRFSLTTYREESRWRLLLLWPFLLVTSAEFREQFWAAVRGQRPGSDEAPLAAGGKQA